MWLYLYISFRRDHAAGLACAQKQWPQREQHTERTGAASNLFNQIDSPLTMRIWVHVPLICPVLFVPLTSTSTPTTLLQSAQNRARLPTRYCSTCISNRLLRDNLCNADGSAYCCDQWTQDYTGAWKNPAALAESSRAMASTKKAMLPWSGRCMHTTAHIPWGQMF